MICLFKKTINYINAKISRKLIMSYIIMIFIPMIAISIYSYSQMVKQLESTFNKDSINLLKSLDMNIQTYFEDIFRLTNNAQLSQNIKKILDNTDIDPKQRYKNLIEFDSFAINIFGARDDIEAIFLIDNTEFIYERTKLGPKKLEYDISKEEWYQNVLKIKGKPVLFGSHMPKYISNFSSDFTVTVARNIINFDTFKTQGVLGVEVGHKIFYRLIDSVNTNGRKFIIVDKQRNIVFDNHSKSHITKSVDQVYPWIAEEKLKTNGYTSTNGYLLSIHKSKLGWTFIGLSETDILLKQFNDTIKSLVIVVFFCLVIFLFFSFGFSYNITKPIKLLQKAMRNVETGDFSHKVNLSSGGEIEDLGKDYNIMIDKIRCLIQEVYKNKYQKLVTEFKALQAQVNPHFLYNALDNINCMAQLEDAYDTSRLVRCLGKIFRYNINNKDQFVFLKDELNHINNYFLLANNKYNGNLEMRISVPDQLMSKHILKFILQPLVENAIKHAFKNPNLKGLIEINAFEEKETLIIKVQDDGEGIKNNNLIKIRKTLEENVDVSLEKEFKSQSIGLLNIHFRIKLYYGEEYGIKVFSNTGEGTTVEVMIPSV
ncbi:MAG: histidine kinase [Firmicutes bacterium]|nr:histidine kinase [Bacillota bacterium]